MSSSSKPVEDEELRWACLEKRDQTARFSFVYAVKTTGIYCRPGCSSRLPRRENAVYFDNIWDAKSAGYRACKRCHPDSHAPKQTQIDAVQAACKLIDQSDELPKLDQLAEAVHYSPAHFQRLFKQLLGVTPKGYAAMRRAGRVRKELLERSSVTEAVHRSGYGTSNRFYEESQEVLGMKPSQYRSGASGIAMHVAVAATSLGNLLVAATEKGLCAIEFGENSEDLWGWFHARFPSAQVVSSRDFDGWLSEVCQLIDSPSNRLALPLDIQGTAFQRLVWEELRRIPVGSTATYSEVAKKIGRPSATRAVAGACAANRLAVVIPCHRVVRSDGGMGGYRWGVARKEALLAKER